MVKRRGWIALLVIPICLTVVLLINTERAHPASSGGVIDPTCTSSSPCIEYDNDSTGQGLKGVSLHGNGVTGWTKWNSTSTGNAKYGVVGNDQSTSGIFDGGVLGKSVSGIGVYGVTTTGYGVWGDSNKNIGVYGATHAISGDYSGYGVRGDDQSADPDAHLNYGVYGFTAGGTGVGGTSLNFVGVSATGGGGDPTGLNYFPALSVIGNPPSSGLGPPGLIFGCPYDQPSNVCDSKHLVFSVDQAGNIIADNITLSGEIFTSGSCKSGCSRTQSYKQVVRFYTPRETLPTVEDVGEARLVGGSAYVRIDSAFADTIDPRAAYMVTITPEGDSNGLYVTAKTLDGFEVHENRGGRSTLAFSYRIVAKPYGETAPRLQRFAVRMPRAGSSLRLR